MRILIIRPDRLGDVLLSTPVFDVIKRHNPRAKITVLLRESVAPVIQGLPSVDEVMIFEPDGRHSGLRGFFRLRKEIKAQGFRMAVVLQSHWKIAAALFFAGVRYRVGPYSKIHSFVFYNRGVRQHRSDVEMHEADYNLQLLRKLGIRVGTRNTPTRAHVTETSRDRAREFLIREGWKPGETLIAVHPGMGGSALNWPEPHYIELLRLLVKDGRRPVVTGGPGEEDLLRRVREGLGALSEKVIFYGGASAGSVAELAGLYSWIHLCVAPSTGPLHLAVALGKPVVTFFPPVRVQSALRWGPYVLEESRARVIVPEVYCGEDFSCRGSVCNHFPCMKSLTVTQALEQVNLVLDGK